MNNTELRHIYQLAGLPRPPRNLNSDELSILTCSKKKSNQDIIRKKVQTFVQQHWDVLSETLTCSGDCAELVNSCTDAQASICYLTNQREVD